jgi:hypothetical protein
MSNTNITEIRTAEASQISSISDTNITAFQIITENLNIPSAPVPICRKLGTHIMSHEIISTAYYTNPFDQ